MPDTIQTPLPSLFLTYIFASIVVGLFPFCAFGQTVIAEVEFQGKKASYVEITVMRPKAKPMLVSVKPSDQFPSGTIFQIPANTIVWLTSNNNRQRLGPGSKHQAVAGPKGESHQTFVGMVTHYVTNVLNFYKASGPTPKYQGAVEGTVFTVEALGKDVKFETTEGSVAVQRKMPLTISEQAKVERKKERELTTTKVTYVNAGDSEQTFDHSSNEQVTYSTYEEAIAAFQQQLDEAFNDNVDAEYLVDDYATLGELYLDMGEPEAAIDPLEKALALFVELDPDDPFIAEGYLNLAEAYFESGDEDQGDENWNMAVDILTEEVEYYREDYQYFLETDDKDTAWSMGLDLVDMYDDLGWAYEMVEDYEPADEYYDMAEELEKELEDL